MRLYYQQFFPFCKMGVQSSKIYLKKILGEYKYITPTPHKSRLQLKYSRRNMDSNYLSQSPRQQLAN
jgi:hypothetical protein